MSSSAGLRSVVYIAGSGRSGSTILDMMLGGNSCVLSLGQFDTFAQWIDRPEPCTCGESLADCRVWSDIVREDRARPGSVIPRSLHDHSRSRKVLAGIRSIRGLQRSTPDSEVVRAWRLFERVASSTGKEVLVDSSKSLLRLVRLASYGDPRLRVIHLVRDPRGFVTSTNTNREYLVGGRIVEGRLSKVEGTLNWTAHNALVRGLLKRHFEGRYLVVLYEDLVGRPRETLRRVCDFLEIPFEENMLPPIDPSEFHLIGGNSERRAGYSELRLDERWRSYLSGREQRLIGLSAGWLYRSLARRSRTHSSMQVEGRQAV